MKVAVYTFRTFPHKEKLKEIFGDVFVFGELKADLLKFAEIIKQEKPELILGVALAAKESRLEICAINKFNNGKVTKNGPENYPLTLPASFKFPVNLKPKSTFCNWTAYKLSEITKIPVAFIHINDSDLDKLKVIKEK